LDKYLETYIKVHVSIDAGGRVWHKGNELPIIMSGNTKKVVLPISKQLFTFDDIKRCGAKVDVATLFSLAKAGAEGRWKEEIIERRDRGLPSNVYVANARSIQYALDKGNTAPPVKFVGRERSKITEVYDTVDEVVDAMANAKWRTEFSRGRYAKRRTA
jgi:hypothetical protein